MQRPSEFQPKRMMPGAKFYEARLDTRWHVYPQQEPIEIVAHDWHGFWAKSESGEWFKSPVSYVLVREISEQEANA